MSANPGYLKVQKKYPEASGMIRMDAVKLVMVSAIPVPPRADNIDISGILKPGQILTGSYEYVNDTGYKEAGSIKKWYSSDKNDESAVWTEIGTGDTYTLQTKDAGKYIKYEVTPKADTTDAALATGETVSCVLGPIPDGDKKPVASNINIEGSLIHYLTLTATYEYSDVNRDPEGETSYQWYRGDSKDNVTTPIIGASGTAKQGDKITYTLTEEDIGKYIRIGITPKNSVSNGDEAFSAVKGAIKEMPSDIQPNAISPVIIGAGATDRELTAGYRYAHPYSLEEGDTQFQWYISDSRNGPYTAIPGATEKIYNTVSDQMGKYLKVAITPVVKANGTKGPTVESNPLLIKWKLSWSDEFDYTAVDGLDPNFTKDWVSANQSYQGWIDSGRWPKNVEVSNGTLKLKQYKEDPPLEGQKWSAGSVWTKDTYGYGMYEAKYKYAPATGLNQSFWLMTPGGYMQKNGYEIDINEGHYPSSIHTNLHWMDDEGKHQSTSIAYAIPGVADMSEDYHIFNMDWNENEIVLYADGVEYRRLPNNVARAEKMGANIYFSEAVLRWAGEATDAIDGSIMEVDYVRYYQLYDESFIDTDPLADVINKANKTIETSKVGNTVACYPRQASFDTLQGVIDEAQAVLDNDAHTKEQVNNAYNSLNAALDTFYSGMVAQGSISTTNSPVYIPEYFDKDIAIYQSALTNDDLEIKIKPNSANGLDKAIEITYPAIIGRVQTSVTVTLNAGTSFTGVPDEQGYVTIKIPKLEQKLDIEVPGTVSYIMDMGDLSVSSNAVRVAIKGISGKDVGFVKNGEFTKIVDYINTDNASEAQSAVVMNSMALSNTIKEDTVIWARTISPIILYEEKHHETDGPVIGGNPNPPYYPDEKPSPSPSEEPTVSPSTEPTNNPVDFKDIKDHWAEKEIVELAEQDIIKGVTEDEFMPDKSITRAEFTALIVRTLGLELADYKNGFNDVKETDWFAQEIQTALENRIISKDEMFRPNDTMTREEMTKVMVEALKNATGEEDLEKADLGQFKDENEISGWAKEYVAEALHTGLIKGISEEEFSPKTNATRAQGAVMIHRLLGMIAKG